MIEVIDLELEGVKLIRQKVFSDDRGFFIENYRAPLYIEKGVSSSFLQDNLSFSQKKTIRGMHYQAGPGQAKLISVVTGTIYDVFVDIRLGSPTFGKWGAVTLSNENREQLFIPEGFAHGFAALEDSYLLYKVSTLYHPETEKTFHYDDPEVGITWPFSDPILSEKDLGASPMRVVVVA